MRLIVVRHCQTPSNLLCQLDTAVPGAALTYLGEQQANALVDTLAKFALEGLYTSVQLRAQMSAAPLAAATGLVPQVRDGLREISAGDLEMLNDSDSIGLYEAAFTAWARGALEVRIPGGESGFEALGRFSGVVQEAAERWETAALFTHGAIARSWIGGHASNVDAEFIGRTPIPNGGYVVLDGGPDDWLVTHWSGTPATWSEHAS